MVYINRFTVADPDLQIKGREGVGGGSHPDPEIRGGVSKIFFRPFGLQFGLKIKLYLKFTIHIDKKPRATYLGLFFHGLIREDVSRSDQPIRTKENDIALTTGMHDILTAGW